MSTPFRCRNCGKWSDFLVSRRRGLVCPACATNGCAPWVILIVVVVLLAVAFYLYNGKGLI